MKHRIVPHKDTILSYIQFTGTNVSYKVFPHLGGSLQEWTINDTNIIPPFDLSNSAKEHHIKYATQAVLFPFPNRLEKGRFTHESHQYQLPITEPKKKNAIHGFLKNCSFEIASVSNNDLQLQYNHIANEDFPFAFLFTMRYSFSTNGFGLTYTVENKGNSSFPFGMGWHPYFQISNMEHARILFQSTQSYQTNEAMIPISAVPFSEEKIQLKDVQLDTCFDLAHHKITLTTSDYSLSLKAPQATYLQLFIPDDRKSIAIEPMTCIANAFNNGTGKKVLIPKDAYQFTFELEVKS
ncbi:MAG: hypothetical protein K0U54_02255 [Bacteroidetes bacterium]|nr:hypothetical protein [Bacteroidota bacterium]